MLTVLQDIVNRTGSGEKNKNTEKAFPGTLIRAEDVSLVAVIGLSSQISLSREFCLGIPQPAVGDGCAVLSRKISSTNIFRVEPS